MKTLAELEAIQNKAREQMNLPGQESKETRVVVGLATCGMAAGANEVFDAINDEVKRRHLNGVNVVKTGCIGVCRLEPIVEVFMPGKDKVTYVLMTPDKARQIVAEHLAGGVPHVDYAIGANQ